MEFGSSRTDVEIPLDIISKIALAKELRSLVKIWQGNVRANPLLFEGSNNFSRPIGGISSKLARPQFPAEASVPQKISNGLIFHNL